LVFLFIHRTFPDGVPVTRVGLKDAVEGVRGFLA
jgi:hypothetical protein